MASSQKPPKCWSAHLPPFGRHSTPFLFLLLATGVDRCTWSNRLQCRLPRPWEESRKAWRAKTQNSDWSFDSSSNQSLSFFEVLMRVQEVPDSQVHPVWRKQRSLVANHEDHGHFPILKASKETDGRWSLRNRCF